MIVWRLGGKITTTVLCTTAVMCTADTCERTVVLNLHIGLAFDFVFRCSFRLIIYVFVVLA